MHTVEYRIWSPAASPLNVEFPAELTRGLGFEETSGSLYGSRHGRTILILARSSEEENEEREKVGVYMSRIRGEVFLTETDLAFFKEQQGEVALVVAGHRAGFFLREEDGSIQTVRSHEEFSAEVRHFNAPFPVTTSLVTTSAEQRLMPKPRWPRTLAGIAMLGALPIAALAVLPKRIAKASSALEVREAGGELRISWKPGHTAVLAIDDGGRKLAIPVYSNQSNVTYAPQASEVEVSLVTVDAENQPRRETAHYIAATDPAKSGQ